MSLKHCKSKFTVFIAIKTANFKVITVYSKRNKFRSIISSQQWVLLRTFEDQLIIIGKPSGFR
jgi:hypothetical protein